MQCKRQSQKGSVFLISLMLLIVVTLLTFTVAESVLLQEKMTSSIQDNDLAFRVAEAAVSQAKSSLASMDAATWGTSFSVLGTANGTAKKGYYDGSTCDGGQTSCYVNTLRDLFAESTWANAIETQTVNCGLGDDTCLLTGEYIIVRLGLIDTDATGGATKPVQITSQPQNTTIITARPTWKYKIIARGRGNNSQNERVLIVYFLQSEP